ncbi:hypothetical protein DFH09DRAFT_1311849 [Mycena vulgaris]|nr:hypothetical protein DFH09DRAFT_1311849 [Mycena vulgaris]
MTITAQSPAFTLAVPPPPTRQTIPANPTPWDNLEFTPRGAYEVRRHLGVDIDENGRFNRSRANFLASDIAWLATGSTEDGQHLTVDAESFFPEFRQLYDSLPQGKAGKEARKAFAAKIRRLIFDLATKWDRTFRGTTMVIHVDGTTIPNAPLVPERLKAHCYLPPRFLADHPETHQALAGIVQSFIEHVGIPTAADWRRRAAYIWSMTQVGHLPTIRLPTALIPAPTGALSAYYIFPGRPESSLTTPAITAAAPPAVSPPADEIYDIDEITAKESALMDALDRAANLSFENDGLRQMLEDIREVQQEMNCDHAEEKLQLEAHIDAQVSKIQQLELELRNTRARLATSTNPPSTPPPRHAPPSYTSSTPSRLGSHSAFTSPRGESSSARGQAACGAHTSAFLAAHSLNTLADSLNLIVRGFRPALWNAELNRLADLPDDLTEGLLQAMNADVAS